MKYKYIFYKKNKGDKIWWVDFDTDEVICMLLFSFDKKRVFNYFGDYPDKLTPEQKAIFDKENAELIELVRR